MYIQISLSRFPPHIIAIVIDIDDCMPNRCLNGGTCIYFTPVLAGLITMVAIVLKVSIHVCS